MSLEALTFTAAELDALLEKRRLHDIEETNRRANASWTLMCEKMVAAEREAWQQEREQLLTKIGVLRSQLLGVRMEFGEGSTISNLAAALGAEDAVNAAAIRARST
jgi:hypothetical protein